MDYLAEFARAVDFIEDHLCDDLRVEEVARVAGYSYYHFHRVFLALVGESAGSYLRIRRLTRAAEALLLTSRSILDIAVDYQFESQEAFTRAFKRAYGCSPGVFRKRRLNQVLGKRKQLDLSRLAHLQESLTVKPCLTVTGQVQIVGLRGTAALRTMDLPKLWAEFRTRIDEVRDKSLPLTFYGLCEVDPAFNLNQFTEETRFSEVVGVRVEEATEVPAGLIVKTIPPGKYAVFTHKGPLSTLGLTYDYIWGTWALASGCELDCRDDFELYDERFTGPDDPGSSLDIYLPVK